MTTLTFEQAQTEISNILYNAIISGYPKDIGFADSHTWFFVECEKVRWNFTYKGLAARYVLERLYKQQRITNTVHTMLIDCTKDITIKILNRKAVRDIKDLLRPTL